MEEQIYQGGCHCKAVRFEVKMKVESAIDCNCSICSMRATILTFVPASQFKLLSGREMLTEYQFHKKVIHHYFCKRCGISSFSEGAMPDGTKMIAVNLRCVDGFDVNSVKITHFDGKSA